MAQPTSNPTPAEKTLAEHRALNTLLDEIEQASADAATAAETLPPRLRTLYERLADHFETEEQGGLFEQILELAPEQAHECEKLCSEHQGLLRRVDVLRTADAEARADPGWAASVRAMLAELSGHESRENELLSRVLDGSVEAQD
jgi:iron-sulfur cluster repair protein YtfE (RIC family)